MTRLPVESYEALWGVSHDLQWVLSAAGDIEIANPAALAALGYGAEELRGQPLVALAHPADRDAMRAALASLAASGVAASFEARLRDREGAYRAIKWSAVPALDGSICASGWDRTVERRSAEQLESTLVDLEQRGHELAAARQTLHRLVSRDELTGLFNRQAISEHLTAELDRCARGVASLSLALCAVERGQPAGPRAVEAVGGDAERDEELRTVARELTAGTRSYDWLGRWDDQRFLMLLPSTNASQALAIAERARAAVERMGVGGPDAAIALSIGVASALPGTTLSAEELLHRAEEALDVATSSGGNSTGSAASVVL